MTRSALSDVSLSTISQPVSMASAPRLVAPRRNSRRDGAGMSFAASLIRSLVSTPGICLRGRDIVSSPAFNARRSSSKDHGAQALRHKKRERNVHGQEADDRRHGEEMH